MRITEVAGVASDSGRLIALTSFLTGRAEDTSAPTKIYIGDLTTITDLQE